MVNEWGPGSLHKSVFPKGSETPVLPPGSHSSGIFGEEMVGAEGKIHSTRGRGCPQVCELCQYESYFLTCSVLPKLLVPPGDRLNNTPPSPKDGHILIIPNACEYVTLFGQNKRTIADVIQLRILRQRDHPGLPGWARNAICHKYALNREAEGDFTGHRRGRRSHVTSDARIGVM